MNNALGCTLICLNVPDGLEFGMDYYSFTVTKKFKGINQIPKGLHVIYWNFSGSGNMGMESPRTSWFLTFEQNEIKILDWRQETEDFGLINDEATQQQYAYRYLNFEMVENIVPYDHAKNEQWKKLSQFITPELVSKMQPVGGRIMSSLAVEEKKQEKSRTATTTSSSSLQDGAASTSATIFFTKIPKKLNLKGASPEEVTKLNFDKSALLDQLIRTEYNNDENNLLGELQFAYVCLLMGQNLDGLEQWRDMVSLLCNCQDALYKRTGLFNNFVDVLQVQLETIPSEVFAQDLATNNFLYKCLGGYFEMFGETPFPTEAVESTKKTPSSFVQLEHNVKQLRLFVEKKFGWKFTTHLDHLGEEAFLDDEDAPVVVLLE